MINSTTEVRISDLLAMLLKAFRPILCLTLILGFLGGIYGAYSVAREKPRVTQEDVEAAEQEVAAAERNLALAQSALTFRNEVEIPGARNTVERTKRMIQQTQDYMSNSIYYGMNPFCRGAAHLRFSVEPEDATVAGSVGLSEDPRDGIAIAYTQMCPLDSKTIDQVRSIMGIETQPQYIEELISIAVDDNCRVIEICVYYDDLPVAEQVVNYLYETITARANEILPKHRITVLAAYAGYETDWELNEKHTLLETNLKDTEEVLLAANTSLESLQNRNTEESAVESAKGALSSAQRDLRTAQYSYAKNRPSLRNMAKRAIKFGVIGGVAGLLLGCCITLIKGLFGGVIQNQNEVLSRYTFPLIGILPRTKKVWFGKTIRKLEGEPTGNAEEITQATVQSLLSRIGERSVCLISTSSSDAAKKLAAYTDGKINVLDSITKNADAVKELDRYEGIILVEEKGKARLNAVDAEVLRAKSLNKDVIGIVLA